MQKIRKILTAVSEKTALPTNQPTKCYQQHRSYRTWLAPVQKQIDGKSYSCQGKGCREYRIYRIRKITSTNIDSSDMYNIRKGLQS